MNDQLERTRRLLGTDALRKIADCRIAVFGVGGVGGYVVEALARSGVGTLDLIDSDEVCLTNLNRQIIATHETLGRRKVDVAAERVAAIAPETVVHRYPIFYLPETAAQFDFRAFDYVVDAVDTVAAKIDLVAQCHAVSTPVISCLGCGNRIDPTRLRITDLSRTHTDPLAKVMRREMKKRQIRKLKVLFSEEHPLIPSAAADSMEESAPTNRHAPGSTPFVPAAAGLAIASAVVLDLTGFDPKAHTKGGQQ